MEELKSIIEKFVASGWDLISIPAQQWLDGKADKDTLVSAIKQADEDCGSCGIMVRIWRQKQWRYILLLLIVLLNNMRMYLSSV